MQPKDIALSTGVDNAAVAKLKRTLKSLRENVKWMSTRYNMLLLTQFIITLAIGVDAIIVYRLMSNDYLPKGGGVPRQRFFKSVQAFDCVF